MTVILDTDILSLLQDDSDPVAIRIQRRFDQAPAAEVFTTVISFQEQVRGWLAAINHPHNDRKLLTAYEGLFEILKAFACLNLWPFEADALQRFHELRKQGVGIGTHDLCIAAIALTHNAKVVTRNLRDFEQVPGLVVEDWTA